MVVLILEEWFVIIKEYLWPTVLHKVLSLEKKHSYELVIIDLVAMQGCSYLKSQASGQSRSVPQLW